MIIIISIISSSSTCGGEVLYLMCWHLARNAARCSTMSHLTYVSGPQGGDGPLSGGRARARGMYIHV